MALEMDDWRDDKGTEMPGPEIALTEIGAPLRKIPGEKGIWSISAA